MHDFDKTVVYHAPVSTLNEPWVRDELILSFFTEEFKIEPERRGKWSVSRKSLSHYNYRIDASWFRSTTYRIGTAVEWHKYQENSRFRIGGEYDHGCFEKLFNTVLEAQEFIDKRISEEKKEREHLSQPAIKYSPKG